MTTPSESTVVARPGFRRRQIDSAWLGVALVAWLACAGYPALGAHAGRTSALGGRAEGQPGADLAGLSLPRMAARAARMSAPPLVCSGSVREVAAWWRTSTLLGGGCAVSTWSGPTPCRRARLSVRCWPSRQKTPVRRRGRWPRAHRTRARPSWRLCWTTAPCCARTCCGPRGTSCGPRTSAGCST